MAYDPIKLERLKGALLPDVPVEAVYDAYADSAGKELEAKFFSSESSAALAANAFGYFLHRPADLPPLPGTETAGWPPSTVRLEAVVRFPWPGGRHPHVDVLIETQSALLGIESKRYEPFRPRGRKKWSDAYWRDCWGERLNGYKAARDLIRDEPFHFTQLDAPQLIKHAFGLRTQALIRQMRPVLVYLYAEPEQWPDGRVIASNALERHRQEINEFSAIVRENEVDFVSCSYSQLLNQWHKSDRPGLRQHAAELARGFFPSIAS